MLKALTLQVPKLKALEIKVEPRKTRWFRGQSSKPRVFFHLQGESVIDNLFDGRWTRPHLEFKKQGLLAEALKVAGLESSTKAKWSQKAGCSCPCSPGFILSCYSGSFDIFVDYTIEDTMALVPESVK